MSISEALLDYINGVKISDEEVERRRNICGGCEFKSDLGFCKVCKCILEGDLGKLKAPRERCPNNYWHEQQ